MDSSVTARLLAFRFFQTDVAEAPIAADTDAASEPSDAALLLRARAGEAEALGLLFGRYARLLHGIGRRILCDDAEADDFVQDFFLFLQRKCSIFDSAKSSAGSWIVQMAYYRAFDRRRYLATRHFYGFEAIEGSADRLPGTATVESDYSPEAVFGRNGLEKILKALTEDQRETLRLHFFEGYTLSEIAGKLKQPLGNVRHHYYRGLDKLRKQMFGNGHKIRSK